MTKRQILGVIVLSVFLLSGYVCLAEDTNIPAADLVGWWKLDEGSGTAANDSSGQNNNGTINGGATWITGQINGALNLNGSSAYINVPDSNSLDMDNEMTISAWVKPTNLNTNYCIAAKQPSGSAGNNYPGNYEFRIAQTTGLLNLLHQTDTGSNYASYSSSSSVAAAVWQNVVVTLKTGDSVKFYINGTLVGTSLQTAAFGIVNNNSLRIGSRRDSSYWFKGGIDNVRIYKRALSDSEVVRLYQEGIPQAVNPVPANGATNVSLTQDLSWTAYFGAVSHDVYFGTENPPPFIGNQTATTYDTAALNTGTTYYWRIDEHNSVGTTTGTLWSFTTVPPPPALAGNPTPADTATDISCDQDLTWTPGSGAASHDVYFGTVNPPPFIRNQTAAAYDTGTMSVDTTYYWRIDERNTSGTTTGTLWSFTTAPLPAPASNPTPSDGATNVIRTQDLSWTAGSGTLWHDVYFGTVNPPPYRRSPTDTTFDTETMAPATTYYWRIDENNAGGVTIGTVWSFTTVPLPDKASNPNPANIATNISLTPVLSWTAGNNAASHNVYFGTASSPPLVSNNQAATAYTPGTLTVSKTYYWRIDEVGLAGTTTGTVWNFTTVPPPPAPAAYPTPYNGATNISCTQDLFWTAGSGTTSHDVYFGTVNPPPFIGNQTAATYDIGTMNANTTYYWRIDEQNVSGTTTGNLWSFTTAPPPSPASNPIPSDDATNVNFTQNLTWTAGSGATSHDVYFGTANPPSFKSNQTSTTYAPGTMVASTTYYWRIDEKNTSGTTTGTLWSFTTAPPPSPASNPIPSDDATNVNFTQDLTWTAGSSATSHDVYFGTVNPPPYKGTWTTTTYDTGTMALGTTYYWRIDEKNAGGITTGLLWHFTTIATAYSGGSGDPNDPYRIATVADWNDLMHASADWNKHFIMTADVNLLSVILMPVGNSTNRFTGVFDGNSHIIRNADINSPSSSYIGLFGCTGTGSQIRNLGVKDVKIAGRQSVGGLVGENYSSITNCYSTGTVSGYESGGLVGVNYRSITNCYSMGTVSGSGAVGGLVGWNYDGSISNCYSTGTASGSEKVGGLVGENYAGIGNCYATGIVSGDSGVGGLVGEHWNGSITNCYSMGTVSGSGAVGGLVGYNNSWISTCYSMSTVSGTSSVGGLAGHNGNGIYNCYSMSNVSGFDTVGGLVGNGYYGSRILNCYTTGMVTGNSDVGGLVGSNIGCGGGSCGSSISNCYSTGAVIGSSDTGGLVGYYSNSTINNSFWDVNTSGQSTSACGTGKTSAEMKIESTFTSAGWDFVGETANGTQEIWAQGIAQYPHLSWQTNINIVTVPDVVSMTQADAETAIIAAELVIGTIINSNSDTVPVGEVISQNPTAGIVVPRGTRVDIVISIGPRYSGGLGTAINPYQIASVSDWNNLMHAPVDWNKYLILTADVDLQGVALAPVGNSDISFTGVFDGKNHIIRNVVIYNPAAGSIGLFGCLAAGAHVRNLGLEDVNVTGSQTAGGLVGVNSGNISNCYSTGVVSGTAWVGGLVGYNCYYSGSITNCYTIGIVNGIATCGGLAGYNRYGTISNCYTIENVYGGPATGGLVGYSYSGTISNCHSTGIISGSADVGGLVGYKDYGSIIDCYSTGLVTGSSQAGGLVGTSSGGTAANSFWDVNTSGQSISAGGTGKTTAQMKTESTFTSAGWDFSYTDGSEAIWYMAEDGYPIFTWQISPADIYTDGKNNFLDFAVFASYWMRDNCRMYNNFCDWSDLNFDGSVDIDDLIEFMNYWLQSGIYE